jgi:hypothetical protein
MGCPPLHSIRESHRPNTVFSASLVSSNQDEYDLSDAGFFYTVVVIDKQKLFVTRRNIFLKTPLIKNCFVTGEKDDTICFHCGVALKESY